MGKRLAVVLLACVQFAMVGIKSVFWYRRYFTSGGPDQELHLVEREILRIIRKRPSRIVEIDIGPHRL